VPLKGCNLLVVVTGFENHHHVVLVSRVDGEISVGSQGQRAFLSTLDRISLGLLERPLVSCLLSDLLRCFFQQRTHGLLLSSVEKAVKFSAGGSDRGSPTEDTLLKASSKPKDNLFRVERRAPQALGTNADLTAHPAVKGNARVIVNTSDCN
jgi:hypothetical protein